MTRPLPPPARSATRAAGLAGALVLGLLSGVLTGCAALRRGPAFDLTPAQWARAVTDLGLDPASVPSPVAYTPEMERAARVYARTGMDGEKLDRLHAALLDRKTFAFDYEKSGTFTAEEAFKAHKGNCVSFANLLVAFGRSLQIPVQAGLVMPRGASEKSGDLIVVYAHMVAVRPHGTSFDVYDFYQDKVEGAAELRLLDDLEVAAIAASNKGVAALEAGDLPTARSYLERAVKLGPRLPDTPSNLGIVLWRQGDVDDALATFRRGLEVDPHRAALLYNLAALYVQLGRSTEARAALAAASLGQASPYLFVVKGDLEFAGGELKAALRSYKKAHARDGRLLEPLLGIARVEIARGRPDAARKALEKARKLAPGDPAVTELLGSL